MTDTTLACARAGLDYPVHQPEAAEFMRRRDLRIGAHEALKVSDTTLLRCVENGVALPAEWRSYREALRAIAGGSDATSPTLPPRPAYPAGT